MRITKPSIKCVELVKLSESFKSKPYLCPRLVPTIGYGTTVYPDGKRVRLADKPISIEVAIQYLMNDLTTKAKYVDAYTRDDITQGMFDALTDFAYNVGEGALKTSRLLLKVNTNPYDLTIEKEFMRWVFGGDGTRNKLDDDGDGRIDEPGEKLRLNGLITRAKSRAKIYFS